MPGLFDNNNGPYQGGGILSGLGNFFAGIGGQMNPAIQESNFRRQAYNALAQQNGPQDAAVLMGAPAAYGLGFNRQLFLDQLGELQRRNPSMSLNEALYRLTPEAQKQQYGITPVPGFKTPSGAEAPGTLHGNQITPPPGMGFGAAPNSAQQPQPSQQPAGGISQIDQSGINYSAAKKGAEELAGAQAKAQPQLPNILSQSNDVLQQIHDLQNDPGLETAVGGFKGRMPALTGPQARVVNRFNQLRESALFQTIQDLRQGGGGSRGAGAANAVFAASGRLLDPLARVMQPQDFRRALQETADRIGQFKKDMWYSAGSPSDQKDLANAFAPKAETASAQSGPKQIGNLADYNALKSGEEFIDPQGNHRRKK